ncbi:pickpocket protein 28-like [Lycorma delicatula]|uniref:pickpocket protein 28-like n=1 Tax=Lycorma delicatula TaxID=130591 RepID=UPI003F5124BB
MFDIVLECEGFVQKRNKDNIEICSGDIPVSPRCEDILKVCLWQDNEVDCCKIFEPIVTNLGICYAFNMVPANILFKSLEGVRETNLTNSKSENETFNYDDYVFWHPQEGYRVTNHSKIKYPRTVNKPGGKDGLSIELFANESEWQYECAGSHRGFWLLLTTAYELPQQDTSIAYHIAMNKFTQINAKPTTINTDLALYSLSSTERQCYFQNENQLKFYRYYTHQNCDDECRFGFLLKRCRSSTDRICTRSDIKCISDAMRKYTHMHGKMGPGNESTRLPCFCMASCFSLSFKYDISASDFIFSNVTPPWAVNTTFNGERDNVGRVSIFSAVGSFLGVKRHKNTSNCGGLLGMLLGFSLISAFEVIYFLSVRPISDKIEFRKKNQMKLIIKKTPCIIYYE